MKRKSFFVMFGIRHRFISDSWRRAFSAMVLRAIAIRLRVRLILLFAPAFLRIVRSFIGCLSRKTLQRYVEFQGGAFDDFHIVYFAVQSYISALIESNFSNLSAINSWRGNTLSPFGTRYFFQALKSLRRMLLAANGFWIAW